MLNIIKKLKNDKKEYREMIARSKKLPNDYQFVYKKLQDYMWQFAGGDGMDMVKVQMDLLELFEMSAVEGKQVLEVTGEDVAGFCDEFMKDTKKWTDHYRNRLNKKVEKFHTAK